MGDRAYATATVYALPDESAAPRVRADLIGLGFSETTWDSVPLVREGLRLGLTYVNPDLSVGTLSVVAERLRELGAVFDVTQDGYLDDPGETRMYTPELGMFCTPSCAEGTLVLTAKVDEVVAAAADPATQAQQLAVLTGLPWKRAVELAQSLIDPDPDWPGCTGPERVGVRLSLCGTCAADVVDRCAC